MSAAFCCMSEMIVSAVAIVRILVERGLLWAGLKIIPGYPGGILSLSSPLPLVSSPEAGGDAGCATVEIGR